MGAQLSAEQESSLEEFRSTVVQLLNISLTYTEHADHHISVKRLKVCRDQVEIITPFMLTELAKAWKTSCGSIHQRLVPIHRQNIGFTAEQVADFLSQFRQLSLPLPNDGTAGDIYNVVEPLGHEHKVQIIALFFISVDHVDAARLEEEPHDVT
jgi:hypothetical protein